MTAVIGDGHRARWEEEDPLLRGAAFGSHSGTARSARREHASPEFRNGGLGVRIARGLRPTHVAR